MSHFMDLNYVKFEIQKSVDKRFYITCKYIYMPETATDSDEPIGNIQTDIYFSVC